MNYITETIGNNWILLSIITCAGYLIWHKTSGSFDNSELSSSIRYHETDELDEQLKTGSHV